MDGDTTVTHNYKEGEQQVHRQDTESRHQSWTDGLSRTNQEQKEGSGTTSS